MSPVPCVCVCVCARSRSLVLFVRLLGGGVKHSFRRLSASPALALFSLALTYEGNSSAFRSLAARSRERYLSGLMQRARASPRTPHPTHNSDTITNNTVRTLDAQTGESACVAFFRPPPPPPIHVLINPLFIAMCSVYLSLQLFWPHLQILFHYLSLYIKEASRWISVCSSTRRLLSLRAAHADALLPRYLR